MSAREGLREKQTELTLWRSRFNAGTESQGSRVSGAAAGQKGIM